MARKVLGWAKVYDDGQGNQLFDVHSLRPDVGDDEETDVGDEDENGVGDDEESDVGDEEDGEIGRKKNKKHPKKHSSGKSQGKSPKQGSRAASPSGGGNKMMDVEGYGYVDEPGQLIANETLGAAGPFLLSTVSQTEFTINEISFEGSHSSAKITKIKVGDEVLFDNSVGMSTSLFSPTSTIRSQYRGKVVEKGLTVEVTGTLTAAGDAAFVMFGTKRKKARLCRS